MAVVKITVCDVCNDQTRKAAQYRVGDDTRLSRIYLCAQHAKPVVDLLSLTVKARRTYVLTSREEVAARAAAAKKVSRKRPVVKRTR